MFIAALATVVACGLVLRNAHYIFHAQLFEQGDAAANSLLIRQAKEFKAMYGQYSRWGFHHPGPAFFYCYAAGETLFYDAFKWVPTPYNGQVLAGVALMAAFFAAAVCTAARWLKGTCFVPIVLCFAALHFGAVGAIAFLSLWPPHTMIMPFLCLLVSAASVAAGRGEDLPLLALACGFMVHTHVAQPLFVLPVFTLAYAGFFVACRRRRPWRLYPRAHWLACGITGLFLYPILADLRHGSDSNFALIWRHLHTYQGERHPGLDSVYYFLQYGGYTPANPAVAAFSGGATWQTVGQLFYSHGWMWGFWLAAIALSFSVFIAPRGIGGKAGSTSTASAPAALHGKSSAPLEPRIFLAWLTVYLVLGATLTLVWGTMQDGPMYYFNAFFNFSLYFVLVMLAAAALAIWWNRVLINPRWRRLGAGAWYAAAVSLLLVRGHCFEAREFDNEECRLLAHTVRTAIEQDASPPEEPRFLSFPTDAWPRAVAVALQLARQGRHARVGNPYGLIFAQPHLEDPTGWATSTAGLPVWRIRQRSDDVAAGRLPLGAEYGIDLRARRVNPAETPQFHFAYDHHDFEDCMLSGWSDPLEGCSYVSNYEQSAVTVFRAVPVDSSAQVELVLNVTPFVAPGKCDSQRLELVLNGTSLGVWRLEKQQSVRVTFPAEVWNRRPEAVLVWHFPDAVSPASLGLGPEPTPLAFALEQMAFRRIPGPEDAGTGTTVNQDAQRSRVGHPSAF